MLHWPDVQYLLTEVTGKEKEPTTASGIYQNNSGKQVALPRDKSLDKHWKMSLKCASVTKLLITQENASSQLHSTTSNSIVLDAQRDLWIQTTGYSTEVFIIDLYFLFGCIRHMRLVVCPPLPNLHPLETQNVTLFGNTVPASIVKMVFVWILPVREDYRRTSDMAVVTCHSHKPRQATDCWPPLEARQRQGSIPSLALW